MSKLQIRFCLLSFLVFFFISGCHAATSSPSVKEAIQGEWNVGFCPNASAPFCDIELRGVLIIDGDTYTYQPSNTIENIANSEDTSQKSESQNFLGTDPVTFLSDNPTGTLEFEFADNIDPNESIDQYKNNNYISYIFFLSEPHKVGYIILMNEDNLYFHSMVSEITLWTVNKSIDS